MSDPNQVKISRVEHFRSLMADRSGVGVESVTNAMLYFGVLNGIVDVCFPDKHDRREVIAALGGNANILYHSQQQ